MAHHGIDLSYFNLSFGEKQHATKDWLQEHAQDVVDNPDILLRHMSTYGVIRAKGLCMISMTILDTHDRHHSLENFIPFYLPPALDGAFKIGWKFATLSLLYQSARAKIIPPLEVRRFYDEMLPDIEDFDQDMFIHMPHAPVGTPQDVIGILQNIGNRDNSTLALFGYHASCYLQLNRPPGVQRVSWKSLNLRYLYNLI